MTGKARIGVVFLGDAIMLSFSFFLTLVLGFHRGLNADIIHRHLAPFLSLYVLWIFVFFIFRLYEIQSSKPTIPNFKSMGNALFVCLCLGLIFFYALPGFGLTPKTNLLINVSLFGILFFVWRRIFYSIFSKYFRKKIVLISDVQDKATEELIQYIEQYPQSGFSVAKIYTSIREYQADKLTNVDLIILRKSHIEKIDIEFLYETRAHVWDFSEAYESILLKIPLQYIDEAWITSNMEATKSKVFHFLKNTMDIACASLLLIVFSPIFFLVYCAIKSYDGGPAFFNHVRTGKNNRTFQIYKFRSMIVNAETQGATWASPQDPRVTPIGRFLRKTHLDELPQVWNILKGDMSFVGPRPERPEMIQGLEKNIPFYNVRHIVKPGFTGWAQVKYQYAGSTEDSKTKLEYDLYYIKNHNIFMDIGILFRTFQKIF